MRKFAVFDIDGTLIRWQLYHALADSLVKLGYIEGKEFAAIKDARMTWKRRENSESFKKYEMQLVKLYENVLSGITVSQFEEGAKDVFEEYKDQVYVYTRQLIKDLKNKGYLLFAISGSQTEVISKMAGYYGFDDFIARVDFKKNDKFTGESTSPIFNKDVQLRKLIDKHEAVSKGSIAVGDSLSDVKMLELVDKPIAFNPEEALFQVAADRSWKIVIERKNMIYELEKQNDKYQLVKTNI